MIYHMEFYLIPLVKMDVRVYDRARVFAREKALEYCAIVYL